MLIGGNGMSEEKKGFFARLKEGLTKTRDNIVRGIDSVSPPLMMISMKSWKKSSLWEISV
jgi:hypothetical protein